MNVALEELRQVDFSRYNKNVKLRYFCSLALRFFNRVVVVRISFFYTQFDKHQDFAFALSEALGILPSLFSPI